MARTWLTKENSLIDLSIMNRAVRILADKYKRVVCRSLLAAVRDNYKPGMSAKKLAEYVNKHPVI